VPPRPSQQAGNSPSRRGVTVKCRLRALIVWRW
jgi:hypothetical protein